MGAIRLRPSMLQRCCSSCVDPTGEAIAGSTALNPVIAGSWRRCALDYCPGSRAPLRADDHRTQRRSRSAAPSTPTCSRWRRPKSTGCTTTSPSPAMRWCSPMPSGIMLYEKTDATLADTFRAAGLMTGADWSERREGTNGIGTCIAENRPIIVHRNEHFRTQPHRPDLLRLADPRSVGSAGRGARRVDAQRARHARRLRAHDGAGEHVRAADREVPVPASLPARHRCSASMRGPSS